MNCTDVLCAARCRGTESDSVRGTEERCKPQDCCVPPAAGELVPGSRVGTSSSRRAAQIKHSYPHLQVS